MVRNEASTRMVSVAFWTFCVIYIAINLLLYFAIPSLGRYGESTYFLRRINIFVQDGFTPYRHLEFVYGPALIYLPAAMTIIGKGFGMSMETAYLITYLGLLVLGLWLLYYVVNNLGCQDFYRTIIYILLAFFFLNVSFGLQYTPTRYVIPFAAILWLHNSVSRQSRLLATPRRWLSSVFSCRLLFCPFHRKWESPI